MQLHAMLRVKGSAKSCSSKVSMVRCWDQVIGLAALRLLLDEYPLPRLERETFREEL